MVHQILAYKYAKKKDKDNFLISLLLKNTKTYKNVHDLDPDPDTFISGRTQDPHKNIIYPKYCEHKYIHDTFIILIKLTKIQK